jgi:hypothetical protein
MSNIELAQKRKKEVITKYGGKNLSRMLGISHPAVSKWKVIPPFRAFQIAKLGDFDIEYIRPDLKITPQR